MNEITQVDAAVKIQSAWRGYAVRKGIMQELPLHIFQKAKSYIDSPSTLENLPKASQGRTVVYLVEKPFVVLKKSGTPANRERFSKMAFARYICLSIQPVHLVIPQATTYQEFIIEKRLPIKMHTFKEQIGLYIECHALFTAAVKEYVEFICSVSLYDTITDRNSYEEGAIHGRYDNIALFLEGGKGKIGLIDLEKLEPFSDREEEWCARRCWSAVTFFPYHLEAILEVGKRFDPSIDRYREELVKQKDKALNLFRVAYENHLHLINREEITLENPTVLKNFVVDEELTKAVEEALDRANKEFPFRGCLGNEPEKMVSSFIKTALPVTLKAVQQLIRELLEGKRERNSPITSYPQLLEVRTVIIHPLADSYETFTRVVSCEVEQLVIEEYDRKYMAGFLLDAILTALAKQGRIAHFIPDFRYVASGIRCIFC